MKIALTLTFALFLAGCGDDDTSSSDALVVTASHSSSTSTAYLKLHNRFKASILVLKRVFQIFQPNRSVAATTAGNVDSVKISFFKMYISPNTDCTSAVLVKDNGSTAVEHNMVSGGTLFSANPSAGTHNCMIMNIEDVITFSPDSTAVAAFPSVCTDETEYTFDIYRTNSGDTWVDIDGSAITATGDGVTMGRDSVYVFASTNTTELAAGSIAPHSNQTLELTSALVVPGATTFYADFSNQVSGDGTCGLEGVTFGFR